MPSPIAHLGVGYAIYRLSSRGTASDRRQIWRFPSSLLIATSFSMLPDMDILPAMLFGDMEKYHNNFIHSFIMGLPAAFVAAAILRAVQKEPFWKWLLIGLISFELHVLMDFFSSERGVMLFWPLAQERVIAPVKLFVGVQWAKGWFTIWHLWTLFSEILFVAALVAGVHFFCSNPRRKKWKSYHRKIRTGNNKL